MNAPIIYEDGKIMAAEGDVATVSNGLPFDESGRLVIDTESDVVTVQNGIPLTADGKVAVVLPVTP